MVYIKEAHQNDGWKFGSNERAGISFRNHLSFGERIDVAKKCSAALNLSMPTLVDTMNNAANYKYSAWPDRVYVIDTDGTIAVQARHGPRGFPPGVRATEQWLMEKFPGK